MQTQINNHLIVNAFINLLYRAKLNDIKAHSGRRANLAAGCFQRLQLMQFARFLSVLETNL